MSPAIVASSGIRRPHHRHRHLGQHSPPLGLPPARAHGAEAGVQHEADHLRRRPGRSRRHRSSVDPGLPHRRLSGASSPAACGWSGAAIRRCPPTSSPSAHSAAPPATSATWRRPCARPASGASAVASTATPRCSTASAPGPYWKPSYWQDCPPISALSVNKSLISYFGPESYAQPALCYTRHGLPRSAERARREGRTRPAHGRRCRPGATLVAASRQVPEISRLVLLMNRPSDNYFAEVLNKRVAVAGGSAGTMRQRPPRDPAAT